MLRRKSFEAVACLLVWLKEIFQIIIIEFYVAALHYTTPLPPPPLLLLSHMYIFRENCKVHQKKKKKRKLQAKNPFFCCWDWIRMICIENLKIEINLGYLYPSECFFFFLLVQKTCSTCFNILILLPFLKCGLLKIKNLISTEILFCLQ